MDRLNAIIAKPSVSLQAQKAYNELDVLNAQLDKLGRMQPTAKVTADTAAAKARIAELNANLTELDRRDVEIKARASADLLRAQAELDRMNAKHSQLRSGADDAGRSLDRLGKKTDTAGQKVANAFNHPLIGSAILGLPAAINLLGAATGAVAGLARRWPLAG